MSEYLNYPALGIGLFLAIVMIVIDFNEKKVSVGMYILLTIYFSLGFYAGYDNYANNLKNISDFKNNAVLKCISGGGLYSSANTFKVSKEDGWEMDKEYFTKGSVMVLIYKCEEW